MSAKNKLALVRSPSQQQYSSLGDLDEKLRSDPQTSSTPYFLGHKGDAFSKLPVEIWHNIVSHLDLASTASLSLTCHRLLSIVGTKSWTQLRYHMASRYIRSQRMIFLAHLDLSLPKHWLCPRCCVWHRKDSQPNSRHFHCGAPLPVRSHDGIVCAEPRIRPPGSARITYLDAVSFYDAQATARALKNGSKYGRKSIQVRTACCNRHVRQRADPCGPLASHTWLGRWMLAKYDHEGWTYRVHSKLVAGSLLLRIDHTRYVPAKDPMSFRWKQYGLFGCWHVRCSLERRITTALEHIEFGIPQLIAQCGSLLRCYICLSDYLIQLEPPTWFGGKHRIVVSHWTDLGHCRDSQTDEWRGVTSRANYPPKAFPDDASTVRSRFETSSCPPKVLRTFGGLRINV